MKILSIPFIEDRNIRTYYKMKHKDVGVLCGNKLSKL